MRNLKHVLVSLGLASFMLVGGTAVAQTALTPGSFLSNSGNALENSDLAEWSPIAGMSSSFTAETFNGVLGSWVTSNASVVTPSGGLNPYGLNALTFVYQFSNALSSADGIEFLTLKGFTNYATSVAYSDMMTHTDLVSVGRSINGNIISASWQPSTVPAGGYGELIVYTNATSYHTTTASIQDGSNTSATVFAPVPEPETYAMMLAGLGLMGFIARRRKQSIGTA